MSDDDVKIACRITHMGQTLGMGVTEASHKSVARNASLMKAASDVEEWNGNFEYGIHCGEREE